MFVTSQRMLAGGPGFTSPAAAERPAKLAYIDAVRGWAILLVITSHVGASFPELPYPVRKLTNFGWHGVQMFFLASAVTLLMSWHRRPGHDWSSIRGFFLRRFFRIAPMYYMGAVLYYLADPPASGFELAQALRSLAFVNTWTPDWTPTTPGWTVVPGGWSIGVEFTFYAAFPVLAALVVNLRRAIALFAAALGFAVVANDAAAAWLTGYSEPEVSNFLYFWFPNQAPIFALGFVLYFLLLQRPGQIRNKCRAYGLLAAIVAFCVLLAEQPSRSHLFQWSTGIPTILMATLAFMTFILVLARGPETVFTHHLIRRMGTLSFSAYVVHLLFVHHIPDWTRGLIDRAAVGWAAIGQASLLGVLTVIATAAAAAIAHRLIELPGLALATRLTSLRGGARLRSQPVLQASARSE